MKLAFVQSFLPSRSHGGVGYFTHYFANHMTRRGHEITVFSLDPRPADALYRVERLELPTRLQKSRLARLYGFAWLVARQDFSPFELIHAQGDDFLIKLFERRRPVLRTFSGSALNEARYARKWSVRLMQLSFYPLEWLSGGLAQERVAISKATCRALPFVKEVIPQGVDLTTFRPGPARSEQPAILFVGHRLRDRKRGYLVLEAFKEVIQPRLPQARLWLVCDDPVENEPGVTRYHDLSEAELVALYQKAWILCLPSSYEGFGRPYIEAMACGTPVVSTTNSGAGEVLENGRYGVITEAANLGQALLDLLQDPPRQTELSRLGLERAAAFDWPLVADRYEKLYAELLARRP